MTPLQARCVLGDGTAARHPGAAPRRVFHSPEDVRQYRAEREAAYLADPFGHPARGEWADPD